MWSNTSCTCIIAYIALGNSNSFLKARRCINLNGTTSLPHSPFAHKTIYNLFPSWWLPSTYAEVRVCRSNLLLPVTKSPFYSIKRQQWAWNAHTSLCSTEISCLTSAKYQLYRAVCLSLWARAVETLSAFLTLVWVTQLTASFPKTGICPTWRVNGVYCQGTA